MPGAWTLSAGGGELSLEVRWLTPGRVAVALALQAAAVAIMSALADGHGGRGLRFALFLVVTMGAYVAAAVALNRSRVQASGGGLTVTHGPLPLPGWGSRSRTVPRAEMSQFAVRGRPGRVELWLRLKSGRALRLATLPSTDVALAVEAALRNHLEAGDVAAPRPTRARGLGVLVAGAYLLLAMGLLHRLVLA